MKILILGSGGREHALAWKLKQSPLAQAVFVHPGNAGIQRDGFSPLSLSDMAPEHIGEAMRSQGIELAVIGPEAYLAQGLAEALRAQGFLVVGPDSAAARLETSKVFAKEFMVRAEVPTAAFQVASDKSTLITLAQKFPTVLKLDGLAAGKGVVIAKTSPDVIEFATRVWETGEFGNGPHRVLIENFIAGRELSYLGLCDGHAFIPLSTATDYKRACDRDEGPNTGGMGVVSPSPYFSALLERKIQERIVQPILKQMRKEDLAYRGVLYIGLMITPSGDPYVLEFNARFGDPETQALMLRLQSDLLPPLLATAKGTLSDTEPLVWKTATCILVVAAAKGYPGKPLLGDSIQTGELPQEAVLFFSGVREENGNLITHGGRVLSVGALGRDRKDARDKAYAALTQIQFNGMHYRTDIGETFS